MSSCRTFAILIGSSDPFGCLSEDKPPPELDLRPELCPEKIAGYSFLDSTESWTENETENLTESLTENETASLTESLTENLSENVAESLNLLEAMR